MSTAVSIVRTLLGLLFDHTIGNIVRMIPIIRLPKLERGPVSRGFLALLLVILFFGLTMLFSASYSSAYATSGELYSIIKPQVIIAIVGLAFMWILSNINYRALRLMSESLYIITIVLLILALLSAFLLTSLAIRGNEERVARRTQQQELVSLFAADGMTLDPALIPTDTAVSTYALIRDETAERKAATFLLGDNLERTTQGGGIYTYTSQQGAAAFRDTGSFDAAGSLSQENAEAFCRDFCKAFSYDTPIFTLDETGSGTATAVRLWNGTPVFNAAVTFTIDQGRVLSASGALLPETGAETSSGQKPLSAFAALTAFQQMRHASSSVVSSITEVSLCYELQSTTAAPMALVPSWRIVTDTATFYVNCISGTVRRA